jgi:hypothetical protein
MPALTASALEGLGLDNGGSGLPVQPIGAPHPREASDVAVALSSGVGLWIQGSRRFQEKSFSGKNRLRAPVQPHSMPHLDGEPQQGLRELYRLTKPGGGVGMVGWLPVLEALLATYGQ